MSIIKQLFQNVKCSSKESDQKEFIYDGTFIHMRNTKRDPDDMEECKTVCIKCGEPLIENEVVMCSKCTRELTE